MKQTILLFAAAALAVTAPFKSSAQATNLQDSLALVDLYNNTNGAGWIDHTNWLTTKPIDTWYGLTIAGGRVIQISLSNNKLVGQIPSSLGSINMLNMLLLDRNQLQGSIPSSLGNLSQLWSMDLQHNLLKGSIPITLSQLSTTQISVRYNQFTYDGLESFAGTSVYRHYDPQADIPLIVKGNVLSVSAGGTLSKNTYKWFNNNVLVSTKTGDSTFNVLSPGNYSVTVTNSRVNQSTLYSITSANLQDSTALVDLYKSSNGSAWYKSTNWNTTASLATWYGVTIRGGRVIYLELNLNNLTGVLPTTLSGLSNTSVFDLGRNGLTGIIPPSLANLNNLTALELNNNQLTGTIPAAFGSIPNLGYLILYDNLFTGNIPSEIINSTNLQSLLVDNNQLSGAIPVITNTTSSLIRFSASGNQLTGSIPASLAKLSNLRSLVFSNNQLTGTIPDSICSLVNVHQLELDNNLLTGKIPDSVVLLTQLSSLLLNNNQLGGAIPNLSKLTSINYLNLSSNLFTFSGLETLPAAYELNYAPQANIPLITSGNVISVSAGGTLANNTFQLYKNGLLISTQTGDSSFLINTPGAYNITVTNSIATQLTLSTNPPNVSVQYNSIADGNWNDASIWLGGVVPGATAQVTINNHVTVTTNTTCYSLSILSPGGSITVNTGINLTVAH